MMRTALEENLLARLREEFEKGTPAKEAVEILRDMVANVLADLPQRFGEQSSVDGQSS